MLLAVEVMPQVEVVVQKAEEVVLQAEEEVLLEAVLLLLAMAAEAVW